MAKRDNTITYIILLVVIVAAGYLVYNAGILSGSTKLIDITQGAGGQAQSALDAPQTGYTYNINLWFNPSTVCVGDSTVGFITSNMPFGKCSIYGDSGTGQKLLLNVNLDANGAYSESSVMNSVGVADVVAMCCDANNNCKLSNHAILTVQMCAQPPPQQPQGQYTCVDSDGMDNFHVTGNCQDSYHQAGFQDYCSGQTAFDYYCDASNICQRHSKECYAPNICVGGVCQLPPCGYVTPSSAEVCWNEACPVYGQTCNYIAATLIQPARCECGYPIN